MSIKITYILILLTLVLSYCKNYKNIFIKNNDITNDTLTIDCKSAVIFFPDSLKIEKEKKEIGEENFYVGADDWLFYNYHSTIFLDSCKLKIIHTKHEKYLKFVSINNHITMINLDSLPKLFGTYFFRTDSLPKLIDELNTEKEYYDYFK